MTPGEGSKDEMNISSRDCEEKLKAQNTKKTRPEGNNEYLN